jgi:hypothetical protein
LDTLHGCADEWAELHPRYDPAVHDPILDALSEESCIGDLDDEGLEKLRTLRIFPTDDVLAYELAQGRVPQEMPHSNPGYDIESVDAFGERRFIEVKGIDGPWDEAGVRVSATQFRFAMATGKAAWLYVVEHARDAQRICLHQIPDPANTATDFCFDLGWQAIASETAREGAAPQLGEEIPEVGDEIEIAGGEIVTVVGVDAGLAITPLTVRSAGGEESFVTWRPGQSGSTSRS